MIYFGFKICRIFLNSTFDNNAIIAKKFKGTLISPDIRNPIKTRITIAKITKNIQLTLKYFLSICTYANPNKYIAIDNQLLIVAAYGKVEYVE